MGIFAAAGLEVEAAGVFAFSAGAGADWADAGRQLKMSRVAATRDMATRRRVSRFFKVILHEYQRYEPTPASFPKNEHLLVWSWEHTTLVGSTRVHEIRFR